MVEDGEIENYVLPVGKVLALRVCHADMSSSHGFVWPGLGEIAEASDWKPVAECGNGLHGWLWARGSVQAAGGEWGFAEEGARWLVLEVDADKMFDLNAKVKFPSARVVKIGDAQSCSKFIHQHEPNANELLAGIAGTATAGIAGTATAGDRGTATAGDRGTATAGDRGTATAGIAGTATAGDRGTATAGDRGTATAGEGGTATAGFAGTATAGDRGTATAGDRGTATAGDRGTATAGDRGTATAGIAGTATAGFAGTILLKRWDSKLQRYRWVQGEVDIDGIEADVPYTLDAAGKLVKKS